MRAFLHSSLDVYLDILPFAVGVGVVIAGIRYFILKDDPTDAMISTAAMPFWPILAPVTIYSTLTGKRVSFSLKLEETTVVKNKKD